MKIYALITIDGTACSETGICHACMKLYGTESIKTPDDVLQRKFVDVSGNDAIRCTIHKVK
jgi:hypothetical protein